MNYEEMIRDTDKLIRDIMVRSQIAECIMFGLMLILAAMIIRLWWAERKALKALKTAGGDEYKPTVTDTVQVINGTEFHRMGVPGRRCE